MKLQEELWAMDNGVRLASRLGKLIKFN